MQAIARIDAVHAEDPQKEGGQSKELLYAQRMSAVLAGEILARAGYDAQAVKRVQSLVKKERIKHDPEAQLLEDTTCRSRCARIVDKALAA